MVHSEADYNAAVEASNILFGNATHEALTRLDEETFLQVFEGVEQYTISRTELEAGIPPLDLLAEKTQIFPSKGEARKMIQANGFSLNKEKLTDPQAPITTASLLNNKYLLFQKGKKNYYLVVVEYSLKTPPSTQINSPAPLAGRVQGAGIKGVLSGCAGVSAC